MQGMRSVTYFSNPLVHRWICWS